MPDDTSDYPEWVSGDIRPLSFEGRIKEVIWPFMLESGLGNWRPDIITVTSIFWDDSFLWHVSCGERSVSLTMQHGDLMQLDSRDPEKVIYGLYYRELLWHRSRVVELIKWVQQTYGETTPLMYRTRHIREKNNHGGKLRVFQLDQSNRGVARDFGIPLFTWGDKIEGYVK